MRRSVVFIIALATLLFVAEQASARLVAMSWISESDLKTKCAENGGTFSSSSDGYNCSKKCAGNDQCTVGCSKGQEKNTCNGSVPGRPAPAGSRPGGKLAVNEVLNFSAAPPQKQPKGNIEGVPPAGNQEKSPPGKPSTR